MYEKNELALIWLDSFSLGHKKNNFILSCFPITEEILSKFDSKKAVLFEILGEVVYRNMKTSINPSYISKCVEKLEKYCIIALTRESENYPTQLLEIQNTPLVLYAKGDVKLLQYERMISIVGTRKPTRYGREMSKWFSTELAKNDFVTVSGLAFGIDGEVAENTICAGGKTIAVLGGGLDSIYPSQNNSLAKKIIENGGLLISEYKPNIAPTQYSFPERNRIISGLSNGTLIIEAGEKSGSLITANFAIEQNKELFIVPSNLDSLHGKGSNRLINEIPHSFITSPDDILEFFGINAIKPNQKENLQLSIEEKVIFDVLKNGEIHFDEIVDKTKIDVKTLNRLLTTLEINGIIKKLSGNYFSI